MKNNAQQNITQYIPRSDPHDSILAITSHISSHVISLQFYHHPTLIKLIIPTVTPCFLFRFHHGLFSSRFIFLLLILFFGRHLRSLPFWALSVISFRARGRHAPFRGGDVKGQAGDRQGTYAGDCSGGA